MNRAGGNGLGAGVRLDGAEREGGQARRALEKAGGGVSGTKAWGRGRFGKRGGTGFVLWVGRGCLWWIA